MKSNKITFEMLDSYLKSKVDEKLDVKLVASFDDIPQVKTESDANNYIVMSDDITTDSSGETINRKGYIYSAHKTGDPYTFTGIQDKIEFYPYDLLNNNPFALKNHTHKPNQTDGIEWKDIQNTPDEYMPKKHIHDWEDLHDKPETFPPSEHTHKEIIASTTWDSIENKPTDYTPSTHTHEFEDILNDPYENHTHDWNDLSNKPETFPPSEHTHDNATWDSIENKPTDYTPSEHTHEFEDILNDPYENHTHDWNDLSNKPETFPPSEHTHDNATWDSIENKPTDYTPSTHTHEFEDILNDPYENHTHDWDDLSNKPETFPPSEHTHDNATWDSIENKPTDYTPSTHTHEFEDILNDPYENHTHDWDDLSNKPETFPPSEHTHNNIVAVSTWDSIENKPIDFPPSTHTHEFSDILNAPDGNQTLDFNNITNYPYEGITNRFYNPSFRIYQRLMSNVSYLYMQKNVFPFSMERDDTKRMYFDRWYFCLTSWYVETLTFNNFDIGFKANILFNSSVPTQHSNLGEFRMEQKLHVKDLGYHEFKKNQAIPLVLTLGSNLGSEECIFDKVRVYQNDELLGEIDKDDNVLYTSYTVTDENNLEYINFKFIFSFTFGKASATNRNDLNLEIYYAKLEVGTQPTPFVLPDYDEELNACKKFYQLGWVPNLPIVSTSSKYIDIPIMGYRKMNSKPTFKAANGLYLFNINDETQSIKIAGGNEPFPSEMFILTDTYGLLTIGNVGKISSLNIPEKTIFLPSGSSIKSSLLNRKPVIMLEAEYE